MALTNIEICNNALTLLGERPVIENLQEPRNEWEKLFSRWYPVIRRQAIKKYHPQCCLKRLLLTQDPTYKPEWGFESGYRYPESVLQFITLNGDNYLAEKNPIEGKYILSQQPIGTTENPAPTIKALALMDYEADKFDTNFTDVFTPKLAFIISFIRRSAETISPSDLKSLEDMLGWETTTKEGQESGIEVINGSNLFGIYTKRRI